MKYKSKIDWWYHVGVVLMAGMVLYMLVGAIYKGDAFILGVILIGGLFFLFFLPSYLNTSYTFEEDALFIQRGLFFKRRIPYEAIQSYRKGNTPCDSAALSKDQIIITYRDKNKLVKRIVVSPKKQFDFLANMKMKKGKE